MKSCQPAGARGGFELSIGRLPTEADEGDDWERVFHKTLYRETNHKACKRFHLRQPSPP